MSDKTNRLCELLDERGVEYTTNEHMGAYETSWNGFTATQLSPNANLIMAVTPEQAIAATLGSGICKDVSEDPDLFNCSECGVLLDIASTSKTDDDKWLYKPSFCPNCGKAVER